jgi:hypothetical protein
MIAWCQLATNADLAQFYSGAWPVHKATTQSQYNTTVGLCTQFLGSSEVHPISSFPLEAIAR